jgi:hypothetical protein
MPTKPKAFYNLLIKHSSDSKRIKQYINQDRRLTQDEKAILNSFLLMRENKNHEALVKMERIKVQTDVYVEAVRLLIIGSVLNNIGEQTKAFPYFEQSYESLPKKLDIHLEFILLLNMFIIVVNNRNLELAKSFIVQLSLLENLNNEDSLTRTKANFNYYTLIQDHKKAAELYSYLKLNTHQLKPHSLISYYFDVWDYALMTKDFELCGEVLKKIKEQKVYSLTQNYNYMKILLKHFMNNSPIFINEQVFKGFKKLKTELMLIRALEVNRITEAKNIWQQLHLLNPNVFQENYNYNGPITILGMCIEKHKGKFFRDSAPQEIDTNKSLTKNIKKLLEENSQLSKEDLFFALFGRVPDSKFDLARLSREIYKCKQHYNLEIETKKGIVKLLKAS